MSVLHNSQYYGIYHQINDYDQSVISINLIWKYSMLLSLKLKKSNSDTPFIQIHSTFDRFFFPS